MVSGASSNSSTGVRGMHDGWTQKEARFSAELEGEGPADRLVFMEIYHGGTFKEESKSVYLEAQMWRRNFVLFCM